MEKIHRNVSERTLQAKESCRDRIDLLRSRVSLLTGKDKLLMTMYLRNGNTFYQMAKLTGVNEATVARRIYKVTKRLMDGEYITCLRNRDKFTEEEMAVARDYFLGGKSIKKIAVKRRLSYYRVRQTLKKIQEIVKTIGAGENKRFACSG